MSIIRRLGARFLKDENGGSMLAYALLTGFFLLAAYSAISYQGNGPWQPPQLFKMPKFWGM